MNNKDQDRGTSYFAQMLLKKIEEKNNRRKTLDEFQDIHWDDVYDVYYDSSN